MSTNHLPPETLWTEMPTPSKEKEEYLDKLVWVYIVDRKAKFYEWLENSPRTVKKKFQIWTKSGVHGD